jgi:hypothetical protein
VAAVLVPFPLLLLPGGVIVREGEGEEEREGDVRAGAAAFPSPSTTLPNS